MTVKEAVQVLAILKAAYPNSYKGMTKDEAQATATVWAVQFADVPVQVVLMAVNKLISTSTFPPAICEVKKKLGSLYWEAKEMLDLHIRAQQFTGKDVNAKQIAFYESVKNATQDYKYSSSIEPTIQQIIGKDETLLLGGGE
jgi:hypothetical protein